VAKLLDRSARSGGHRRRPAARNRGEASSDSEKKEAPAAFFDWALAEEQQEATGIVSPQTIWPAWHYRGGSTEDLRSAAMAMVARAI